MFSVVTKKIAHERLTALVFRDECIVTACQVKNQLVRHRHRHRLLTGNSRMATCAHGRDQAAALELLGTASEESWPRHHVTEKKIASPLRCKGSLASDQLWFDIRVNLHLCMWYTHHVTASDVMSCCDLGNTRRYNERTFVWSLLLEAFRRRNNFGMQGLVEYLLSQKQG